MPELIAEGGIGRIAYASRFGPAVLPVNYALRDGAVVFRTAAHSPLDEDLRTGIANADYKVAFEIDSIDLAARQRLERAHPGAGPPCHRSRGGRGPRGRSRALGSGRPGAVRPDRPVPHHRPPGRRPA